MLKGENFGKVDDKILGIAAHYDTVPNSPGNATSADDNIMYFYVQSFLFFGPLFTINLEKTYTKISL